MKNALLAFVAILIVQMNLYGQASDFIKYLKLLILSNTIMKKMLY